MKERQFDGVNRAAAHFVGAVACAIEKDFAEALVLAVKIMPHPPEMPDCLDDKKVQAFLREVCSVCLRTLDNPPQDEGDGP